MRWLAALVAGRKTKWIVLVAWIAILVAISPFGGRLFEVTEDSFDTFLPDTAESTAVLERQESFPGGNVTQAAVIYQRDSGITPEDKARAEREAADLGSRYGVEGGGRVAVSEDGKALIYAVPISLAGAQDIGDRQTEVVHEIRETVGTGDGDLKILVTGPAAIVVDSVEVFEDLEFTIVLVPVVVVAILLLLIYRSPTLFLVPLISVAVAYQVSSAAVYGLAKAGLVLNSLGAAILGILVYGAGTDYALLLIARYREELRQHQDRHEAMKVAVRRTAPALIASAATVAIGLLVLIAADSRSTRALGPVSAIAVAGALFAVMTLLPTLLVLLGRWLFWPFIPKVGGPPARPSRIWRNAAGMVTARPRAIWLVTTIVAAVGWIGLLGFDTPQSTLFRDAPDSIRGQELIVAHFPAGSGAPIDIIAPRSVVDQTIATARTVPGVVNVREVAQHGNDVALQATLDAEPNSDQEFEIIRDLRDKLPQEALVGGRSAINLDLADTNVRDASLLMPLVLVVILVILAVLLRALLAPILLVLTVILSYGTALGISIAFFEGVLGWEGQDASLPLLSFVFLVALGVDYNIFLVSRAREESYRIGTRAGVIRSLVVTGGVITSAGVVLAATFSVLVTLPVLNVAELGFVVALGVLLDTLIVRSLLVPALISDVGSRFWWPSRRTAFAATAPIEPRQSALTRS